MSQKLKCLKKVYERPNQDLIENDQAFQACLRANPRSYIRGWFVDQDVVS
jgi:hypothetical protein